jgi:hypothetical protein
MLVVLLAVASHGHMLAAEPLPHLCLCPYSLYLIAALPLAVCRELNRDRSAACWLGAKLVFDSSHCSDGSLGILPAAAMEQDSGILRKCGPGCSCLCICFGAYADCDGRVAVTAVYLIAALRLAACRSRVLRHRCNDSLLPCRLAIALA